MGWEIKKATNKPIIRPESPQRSSGRLLPFNSSSKKSCKDSKPLKILGPVIKNIIANKIIKDILKIKFALPSKNSSPINLEMVIKIKPKPAPTNDQSSLKIFLNTSLFMVFTSSC